jgi:hypothetical protein
MRRIIMTYPDSIDHDRVKTLLRDERYSPGETQPDERILSLEKWRRLIKILE